jgi:hypothetical protein
MKTTEVNESIVGKRYEYDWAYARLHDEFGSLQHLKIIEKQE